MVTFPLSTIVCIMFGIGALGSLLFFRIRIDPQAQQIFQELRLFNFLTVWNRRWTLGEVSHFSCVRVRGDPDGGTDAWYVRLHSRNGQNMVVREYGTSSKDQAAAALFIKNLSLRTGIPVQNESS
jgi:hypothetical protein